MGRKLMRVPLDFDWPQGQIWKGYMSPYHPVECKSCKGTGYSEAYNKMQDRWYGNDASPEWVYLNDRHRYNKAAWNHNLTQEDVDVLLEHDRLWDFTRVPRNAEQQKEVEEKRANGGNSWLPYDNGYRPSAEEVNIWALDGLGHDSSNAYYCIKAKLDREGISYLCPYCKGEGHFWQSPEIEKAAGEWQNVEPPTGEGYQLWETTSEGSPKSPVFATLDDLCEWCEDNATTFADYHATAEEWKKMLSEDFVSHQEGNIIFM